MAILETVGRIGGTLFAMIETRLELAALEVEEESQRVLGYFMLALLSLILFGIAMVLVSLTIIMVFWDSYRLEAALALAALFGVAGTLVMLKLKTAFATRPRMLASTVAELNKDVNFFRNGGAGHEE
jgi:uncharacterized membrane protein YqjE